jgi:hypothetical protein
LARIITEDQRSAFIFKAEFSLKAGGRKVDERITFTSAYFGVVSKVFRITDKKYSPNGIVELTLKEDFSTIWDFTDAIADTVSKSSNLQSPFLISPLSSITLESGTNALLIGSDGTIISRIHATWPTNVVDFIVSPRVSCRYIGVRRSHLRIGAQQQCPFGTLLPQLAQRTATIHSEQRWIIAARSLHTKMIGCRHHLIASAAHAPYRCRSQRSNAPSPAL